MVLVSLVSYLGNNNRLKRFEVVKKTIKDYLNLSSDFRICVFAQGYTLEEIVEINNLGCLTEEFPPESCSHARNVAIEYLKEHKEYDWMLLSDDDTSLYNYYGVADFISQLEDVPEKVKYINFHQPQISPFKEDLLKHREFYENNFCLKINFSKININPILIRNQEDIRLFDENLKMMDDDKFYVQSTYEKDKVYNCPTIIIKNNAPMFKGVIDYSSSEQAKEYIYNCFGVKYEGVYKPSTLLNKSFKEVINIPRKKRYLFSGREVEIRSRKK